MEIADHSAATPRRQIADIIPPRKESRRPAARLSMYRWLRRRWLPVTVGLLLVLAIVGSVQWQVQHRSMSGSAEVASVEQEVGRHYVLPANEQPVLATVEDETQVTSPFLRQAKNGDRILIYANAKIVIVYRPSIDRIVAVGPVQVTPQASGGTANQ